MPNVIIIKDAGIQGPPGPTGPAGANFPFTGSAIISGSLVVTGSITSTQGFTGSLLGTASYSLNSLFQPYTLEEQYEQYATDILENINTITITGSLLDISIYNESFNIFEIVSDSYVISLINSEGEDLVENNYLGVSGSNGIELLKAGTFFSAPFDSDESGSYFTSITLGSGYADQEIKLYSYIAPPTYLTSSYKITNPVYFTENVIIEDSITVPLVIGTATNAQVADKATSAIENATIGETNTITFTKGDASTFSIDVPPFTTYTDAIQQEELSTGILNNSNIIRTITGSDIQLETYTGSFQVIYVKNASKFKEILNQSGVNITRSLNIDENIILNAGTFFSAPSGSYFKQITFNYGTNQEVLTYRTQISENTASYFIPKENYYLTRSNIKIYGDLEVTGSILGNLPTLNTSSLLTTASVNLNTITFTKGDGSTFPITVNTGSGGGAVTKITAGSGISVSPESGIGNVTVSYAGGGGGGAFPFTGSAIISGSLDLNGPLNVDIQNFNIDNDIFTQNAAFNSSSINLNTYSNQVGTLSREWNSGSLFFPPSSITSGSTFEVDGFIDNPSIGTKVFYNGNQTDGYGISGYKFLGIVTDTGSDNTGGEEPTYYNYVRVRAYITTSSLGTQTYRFYNTGSGLGTINLNGNTNIKGAFYSPLYLLSGSILSGPVSITGSTSISGSTTINNTLQIASNNDQSKNITFGSINLGLSTLNDTNIITLNKNIGGGGSMLNTRIQFRQGIYWNYYIEEQLYGNNAINTASRIDFTTDNVYGSIIEMRYVGQGYNTNAGLETAPLLPAKGFSTNYNGTAYFNVTGSVSASAYYGDGSNLTNLYTTPILFNQQTSSYTASLSDLGKMVELSSSTTINIIIPNNSTVAFPTGSQITFIQTGTQNTTFITGSGVTINCFNNNDTLTGQYSVATCVKKSTNTWYLFGDLN